MVHVIWLVLGNYLLCHKIKQISITLMYSKLLYEWTVLIAAFGGIVWTYTVQVYTHNFLAFLMCLYVAVISFTFSNINDFICKVIHHQKTEIVKIVSKCKVRCMIKQHIYFSALFLENKILDKRLNVKIFTNTNK